MGKIPTKNEHVWGFLFIEKCATLEKDPTPGLTVKMKQDITGTIQKFPAQPSRNPIWNTARNTQPNLETPTPSVKNKGLAATIQPFQCSTALLYSYIGYGRQQKISQV